MQPFRPRLVRFHGVRELESHWRLKVYSVSHDRREIAWPEFAGGIRQALRALPKNALAPGRPALAFLIAHCGATADYVILSWWDQENELPTRVFVKPHGAASAWRAGSDRESFCVWDLELMWFERESYVNTLLAGIARGADHVYVARHAGVRAEDAPADCFASASPRPETTLRLRICEVRSWRAADAASLATHANNRKVWLNLRDKFPHPYALADAHGFIESAMSREPETVFAIAVDGAAVGGIGFVLHDDIERITAEIGYWLGEPYWGRGITTEAIRAVTAHAIERHQLTRVFAVPFARNVASCRVLEKAGYSLETRMRRSALKDGEVNDQMLYAYVVPA